MLRNTAFQAKHALLAALGRCPSDTHQPQGLLRHGTTALLPLLQQVFGQHPATAGAQATGALGCLSSKDWPTRRAAADLVKTAVLVLGPALEVDGQWELHEPRSITGRCARALAEYKFDKVKEVRDTVREALGLVEDLREYMTVMHGDEGHWPGYLVERLKLRGMGVPAPGGGSGSPGPAGGTAAEIRAISPQLRERMRKAKLAAEMLTGAGGGSGDNGMTDAILGAAAVMRPHSAYPDVMHTRGGGLGQPLRQPVPRPQSAEGSEDAHAYLVKQYGDGASAAGVENDDDDDDGDGAKGGIRSPVDMWLLQRQLRAMERQQQILVRAYRDLSRKTAGQVAELQDRIAVLEGQLGITPPPPGADAGLQPVFSDDDGAATAAAAAAYDGDGAERHQGGGALRDPREEEDVEAGGSAPDQGVAATKASSAGGGFMVSAGGGLPGVMVAAARPGEAPPVLQVESGSVVALMPPPRDGIEVDDAAAPSARSESPQLRRMHVYAPSKSPVIGKDVLVSPLPRDLDAAYARVLSTPGGYYPLLRLLGQTGPVWHELKKETALSLLAEFARFFSDGAQISGMMGLVLPWLFRLGDEEHAVHFGVPPDVQRSLLAALTKASRELVDQQQVDKLLMLLSTLKTAWAVKEPVALLRASLLGDPVPLSEQAVHVARVAGVGSPRSRPGSAARSPVAGHHWRRKSGEQRLMAPLEDKLEELDEMQRQFRELQSVHSTPRGGHYTAAAAVSPPSFAAYADAAGQGGNEATAEQRQ